MKETTFNLELESIPATYRLSKGWLGLALISLVIGGLLTILIVLSRTPFFHTLIPWTDFFHTALVVHVDLTVVVWFLAFAGVLWSLISVHRLLFLNWLGCLLAVIGTLLISAAPFLGPGYPLMNNYIPVLQMPIFFIGLTIFGIGFLLLVIQGILGSFPLNMWHNGAGALRFGLFTALITAMFAIMAQIGSYLSIPTTIEGTPYYELLFWGSGHILQFTHTQLMLVVWLWLATVSGAVLTLKPKTAIVLFALGMAPVLLTPYIYLAHAPGSAQHLIIFTWLMKYGGGLAALPLGMVIVWGLIKAKPVPPEAKAEKAALVFSILLFAVGGVIGFMIHGSNVTIPAHYHGSIIAVTIAFMGITYHLLPRLGYRKISNRWVQWQPTIYGTGQIMHVLGLAWSGGYGVQRKMAGSEQGLDNIQQIAGMGLMGLGGMIAIIGGIIFLVVVFLAMKPKNDAS